MKHYLQTPLFVLTIVVSSRTVSGQYISHYTGRDRIKLDTLIDEKSGSKFFIDKQRIYITATDKNGKLLWQTDPSVDNNLEKYRVDRPTIVYFAFEINSVGNKTQVIAISYNNSQFGYLDKTNGQFTFEGQD